MCTRVTNTKINISTFVLARQVEHCAVGGRVPWVIALVGAEGEPSHRGGEATLTIDCAVKPLSCAPVYIALGILRAKHTGRHWNDFAAHGQASGS